MLNISKENNSIRVEATDYSFYPFNGVVTYPSNSVIVVTDKSNMATFKSSTNGDVLFVGNINELTIDGNKVTKDTIVGEFTKIANASASVDAYTKAESDAKLDKKQDKLVAGDNITLTDNPTDGTTTIAAAGGGVNGLTIDENKVAAGLNQTIPDNLDMSVVIGNGATVSATFRSVTIGHDAKTGAEYGTAVGEGANAIARGGTAIGTWTTAYEDGTAIGNGTTASVNAIAIGKNSNSDSSYSISIGEETSSKTVYGLSLGYYARSDEETPLVINAGGELFHHLSMIQGSKEGKISILNGDGTKNRMVIQDEINSLKTKKQDKLVAGSNITLTENTTDGTVTIASTGGSGGTVDAYTKAETDEKLAKKQDKLVAGSNITLTENTADGTVTIASTGGSGGTVDAYTKAESDAKYALKTDHDTLAGEVTTLTTNKQDKLTAGTGITIDGNTISATGGGSGSVSGLTIDENKVTAGLNQTITDGKEGVVAIGNRTTASNDYSIAIGEFARAAGINSFASGYGAKAEENYCVAIGSGATASAGLGVAIGNMAKTTSMNGVAIGSGAQASADNPLVIKAGSDVNSDALPMIQGNSQGKIRIPIGDGTTSTMCLQDEINALKTQLAELAAKVNGTA